VTLTSTISLLLDQKVILEQPDLLVLPDHQDHLVQDQQVQSPVVEAQSISDQAWEAMDHFCTDLADHQDLQDSQDQKVIWDFQEQWDLMERWVLKVFKVFPVVMVPLVLEAKRAQED